MLGDKFHVHYTVDGITHTEPNGPWDTWAAAKVMRDTTFMSFNSVQACWVTRFNPSMDLRQEKYGHTLRRNKYEKLNALR